MIDLLTGKQWIFLAVLILAGILIGLIKIWLQVKATDSKINTALADHGVIAKMLTQMGATLPKD